MKIFSPDMLNPVITGSLTISGSTTILGELNTTTLYVSGSQLSGYDNNDTLNYINTLGVISGSSQISYTNITDKPSGIVSSSAQLTNVTASAVYNVSGSGNTLLNFWAGTQASYNAISSSNSLDANTLYIIKP